MKIGEHAGEGYRRLVENPAWMVAVINYAPRFDAVNFVRMERHVKTDEVFVLLSGHATLVVGEQMERIEMDPTKVYTMECGEWHHILVSRDAKVLVVENADTSPVNTEYRDVACLGRA